MLCDLGIVAEWMAWERQTQDRARASIRCAARAALRAVNGASPVPRTPLEVRDKNGRLVDLGSFREEGSTGGGSGQGASVAAAAAAAAAAAVGVTPSAQTRAPKHSRSLPSDASTSSSTSTHGSSARSEDGALDKVRACLCCWWCCWH